MESWDRRTAVRSKVRRGNWMKDSAGISQRSYRRNPRTDHSGDGQRDREGAGPGGSGQRGISVAVSTTAQRHGKGVSGRKRAEFTVRELRPGPYRLCGWRCVTLPGRLRFLIHKMSVAIPDPGILSRNKRKEAPGTVHMPLGTAYTRARRQQKPPIQGQQQSGGSVLPFPGRLHSQRNHKISSCVMLTHRDPESRLHPGVVAGHGLGPLEVCSGLRASGSHFAKF